MSGSTPLRPASHATSKHQLAALYGSPLSSTRNGPLYSAFPYPTKVDPEAIALYIAAHTQPGATVFDGFAGSGTTGLAALLCEDPPPSLRREAERRGLAVEWGPRDAVLYELSSLGAFVARTLNDPPDPTRFRNAAAEILRSTDADFGWLYSATDPSGCQGTIRHTVWSDLIRCVTCGHVAPVWEVCVSTAPARIDPLFRCPSCRSEHQAGSLERVTERLPDDLIGTLANRRRRTMARIYGITGKSNWQRHPKDDDYELLARIDHEPIPACVPVAEVPWGDLHRRGYHQGISHLHHFYTRRNLITFGRLWERAAGLDASLRDAVRFWLLSYNASHSTIMTRVVAKSGQRDLVVTSAQPGVLYVSGLPVEKNTFRGLGRKLATITKAFKSIHGRTGRVTVHQKSSCAVDLPAGSIDYVFTDPPFGGNIPYSEISFLNEAWLGAFTDTSEEAVVSRAQQKPLSVYQHLLTTALAEVHRVLKPRARATLVFHSASAAVWNALRNAYSDAGLSVEHAGVLDKKQGSFKQVTTNGAVRGDPLLLLRKRGASPRSTTASAWEIAAQLNREARDLDPSEQTPERLYSRFVSHFLAHHLDVPIDAGDFYSWYAAQQAPEAKRAR